MNTENNQMTYTDNSGVEREILNLETRKAKKHGLFTGAAMFCAVGVIVISIIVGLIGMINIGDPRSPVDGGLLLTLAASGLVSALILGLLAEISMKLTAEYLDE